MKKREERYKKAYYAIVALFVAAILWYALEAAITTDLIEDEGYIEVTSTSGTAFISATTANRSRAIEESFNYVLKNEDESLTAHFHCDECDYSERVTFKENDTKIFSCNCGTANSCSPEYYCIVVEDVRSK